MNSFRAELAVFVPIDSSFVMISTTRLISESSSSIIKSNESQFNVFLANTILLDPVDVETVSKRLIKSFSDFDNFESELASVMRSSNVIFSIAVCSLRFFTEASTNKVVDVI